MLRSTLSYSILVLIPAVSLAIAIIPYIVLKKGMSLRGSAKQSPDHNSSQPPLILRGGEVTWKHLWLAFGIGLLGNVIWSWILFELPVKVSDYIYQVELSGLTFGYLVSVEKVSLRGGFATKQSRSFR